MEDSRDLAQRVEHEIAASSRTSPIPPGQSEAPKRDSALVEAINQVFALFRLNYHNQYYAAFSEAEQLRQIKKLWLDSLRDYAPAQVLQGARLAIENSEYLPTLNRMRSCCEDSLPALGLPAARDAYEAACAARAPAESERWSHAVVYWAGRDCQWHILAQAPESVSWPRFRACYQQRCSQLLRGETLPTIPEPMTPSIAVQPLTGDDALAQLRRLRAENDL